MSARRLLLIDPDENFFRILHEQVSPYGFEIYRVESTPDALGYVDELQPELVFIAVEEPDKLGYSLCNKAKKGVARDIPVILTTASVPSSGFNSHRKLRVHADEYIDKRTMTPDELVTKIEEQIGLGALAVEDGVFDGMEEFDMDLDDAFSEEGERTRVAPPNMLMDYGFDEDAAAAASSLTEGSDPFFDEQDLEEVDLPPFFDEDDGAGNSGYDRGATVQADSVADLGTPPPPAPSHADHRASRASGSLQRPSNPNLRSSSNPALDLGLDDVSNQPSGQDTQLRLQLQVLEEENQRLQNELARAQAVAAEGGGGGGGGGSLSREREFLNLREVINKKEREVLDLRDELGGKERAILDGKETIRRLEHTKTALDSKNLELEQRLLEFQERAETLERERQSVGDKVRSLEAALGEARNAAKTERDRLDELQARHVQELASAAAQKDEALAKLRAELDQRAAASESAHKDEIARLEEAHRAAIADARSGNEAALGELREQLQGELEALKQQHATELSNLRTELEGQRAREIQALKKKHQEEVDRNDRDNKEVMNTLAGAAKAELDATMVRHARELEQASLTAQTQLEEREKELREEFAAEKETLERIHGKALAELESERRSLQSDATSAQEQVASLQRDLEAANKTLSKTVSERDSAIQKKDQELAKVNEQVASLEQSVGELEGQATDLQEQVLRAYKKIKGDEATIAKAKKALAIALTLLDDNITVLEDGVAEDSA